MLTRAVVRRTLGDAFWWGIAVVLLAVLLVVARDDIVWIVVAIAVAAIATVIVVCGPDRAGTGFVVLGVFAAPMSALVVPAATFVTATDLLFALGFTLLIPTILQRHFSIPPTFSITALACLLFGIIATLAATDVMTSLNFQARFLAGVLVVPLVFILWRPSLPVVRVLAGAYVLGVAVSFVGGVARGDRPGARFIGFTEHPNILGLTGLFATGLCVFLITQTRRSLAWIWLAGGAMGLGVVWFSGSRAALVVAAIIACIFPVVERSARAAGWLIGAATVGVVALTQIRFDGDSAFDRLTGGGSASWSDAEREMLFQRYWTGFLDQPVLGHGFEESVLGHNVYLQMAFAMGAFGAIAFVLLLAAGASQLLLAPKPFNRLAYPILSYAMIAPLTSVVWDRYIWVPAALAFVLAADMARVRAGQPGDFVMPDAAPAVDAVAPGDAGFVRGAWTGPTQVAALRLTDAELVLSASAEPAHVSSVEPAHSVVGQAEITHPVVEQAEARGGVETTHPVGEVVSTSSTTEETSSTTDGTNSTTTESGSTTDTPDPSPAAGGGGKRRADVPVDAPPRLET